MSEDNMISDADFAKTIRLFVAARGTARLAQEFEVTDGAVARWSQGNNLPQPRIRTEVCAWVEEHLKGSYCDAPSAKDGWCFVPIENTTPLPRVLYSDEYYPLYVRLQDGVFSQETRAVECPCVYIEFMGDDGNARVWAPIESREFLKLTLKWVFAKGNFLYGASFVQVWQALAIAAGVLQEDMTEREWNLVCNTTPWVTHPKLCWCCLA